MLVSMVIIGTILFMIAAVSARQVQDGFFSSIDLGQQAAAQALAEGCMEVALVRLATDSAYTGNETVEIGEEMCTIRTISGGIVEVEAEVNDRYYRLRAVLSSLSPVTIDSWQKVDSF